MNQGMRRTQAELRHYLDSTRDCACVVTAVAPKMLEVLLTGELSHLTRATVPSGLSHYEGEYMEHVVVLLADTDKDRQAIVGAAFLRGWRVVDVLLQRIRTETQWLLEDVRRLPTPMPIEVCGVANLSMHAWERVPDAFTRRLI